MNDTKGFFAGDDVFYDNLSLAFEYKNLMGDAPVTKNDYGRAYTVKLSFMDTVSRIVCVRLLPLTNKETGILDYDYNTYNIVTKAGEEETFSFDYVSYESDYVMEASPKTLSVEIASDGCKRSPIYFRSVSVREHITDVEISDVKLVKKQII